MAGFPFPRTGLSHCPVTVDAEIGVAVQNGDPDLELRNLRSNSRAMSRWPSNFTQCIFVMTGLCG
jgi:hypothetical protein